MQGVPFFSMLLLLAQGNVHGWMPKAYIKPLIRNFHPSPTQTTVSSNPKSSENQLNPIIDDRLSLDMFSAIGTALNNTDSNAIVSPASIQPLLLLLAEGLTTEEFHQLMHAMHLPIQPKSVLYEEFHKYRKLSMIQTPSVELLSSQSIFIDQHRPQDIRYIDSLQRKFKVKLETMDFEDTVSAARLINNHVVNQTRGKIASVVQPQFLVNAKMVLTSSIYFNGKWKHPFNSGNTLKRPFYKENGESIGNIPMMMQTNRFRQTVIDELNANILELPYGTDDRYFMWILLPTKDKKLIDIITAFRNVNVTHIADKINQLSTDEQLDVIMPKFKINSGLNLRPLLKRMGITDKNQNNFDIFHKAIVEVDEEGTIAAANTERISGFGSLGEPFNINRPFVFLIIDRHIGAVLFAGQVRTPMKH